MRRPLLLALLLALLMGMSSCFRTVGPTVRSSAAVQPAISEERLPKGDDGPVKDIDVVQPSAVSPDIDAEEIEIFADGSYELERAALVRASPSRGAAELGKIAAGARLARRELIVNDECKKGWLAVIPQGFICASLIATKRWPDEQLLPHLRQGKLTPGTYGKVRDQVNVYATKAALQAQTPTSKSGSSLTVRRMTTTRVDGVPYWRTQQGLIAKADIRRFRPSRFAGQALGDASGVTLPVAWTLPDAKHQRIAVRKSPTQNARIVRRMAARTTVELGEASEDGRFVRVAADEWIARSSLRVATAADAPTGLGPEELWIDIDLDEQTLVAYEGAVPVYATMVSTGRVLHRTPTGVFRIGRKVAERTMNSMSDATDVYSVAKVPWTAYFARGYALHAAYWHTGFGRTRSHGCVNLSPTDARHLYDWMAPLNAPGWAEVYGHEDQPGSVVRIRNRRHPQPKWKGYAKGLLDRQELQPA